MARKLTYEDVKHFIEVESGSGCKLLSKKYDGVHNDLEFQCKCGNKFKARYSNFTHQNKRQCNKCGNIKKVLSRRKTNDEFVKEVFELVGNEYVFLDKYINSTTKLKCQHNKCGCRWYILPLNFLKGRRCPNCNKNYLKTNDDFQKEVYHLVGNEYEFLEEYINAQTPIICKHNKCGYKWYIKPNSFLGGTRCPNCNGGAKHSNEQFKKRIYKIVGTEYTFLDEYINSTTKLLCRHNICGYTWHIKPANFISGRRCPQCAESIGERRVREYLRLHLIDLIQEKSFNDLIGLGGGLLRFDFYLPDINVCIEYDGEQHFDVVKGLTSKSELENIRKHDQIKNQYCKDNNIPLLRIPYWEFDNIEIILEEWLTKYGVIHKQ